MNPTPRSFIRTRKALLVFMLCLIPATEAGAQGAPGVVVAEVKRIAFPLTVEALGTAGPMSPSRSGPRYRRR